MSKINSNEVRFNQLKRSISFHLSSITAFSLSSNLKIEKSFLY